MCVCVGVCVSGVERERKGARRRLGHGLRSDGGESGRVVFHRSVGWRVSWFSVLRLTVGIWRVDLRLLSHSDRAVWAWFVGRGKCRVCV